MSNEVQQWNDGEYRSYLSFWLSELTEGCAVRAIGATVLKTWSVDDEDTIVFAWRLAAAGDSGWLGIAGDGLSLASGISDTRDAAKADALSALRSIVASLARAVGMEVQG